MTKRTLIAGHLGSTKAERLVRYISDNQPDELVCFEVSVPMLDSLRGVYSGPIGAHSGSFDVSHRVVELPDIYSVAPGWVSTCRVDGYTTSRFAGTTALNATEALQANVVLGHTGRLGMGSRTIDYGGKAARTVTGMEVGRCDQAVGLLNIDRMRVSPELIVLHG